VKLTVLTLRELNRINQEPYRKARRWHVDRQAPFPCQEEYMIIRDDDEDGEM